MSDTQKIQWDQPLEAVHTDGRVVPVSLDPNYAAPDGAGHYTLNDEPERDSWYTWTADGKAWMDDEHVWTIRNATSNVLASATPTRTALEQSMEELVRRMATYSGVCHTTEMLIAAEDARAILAELEPVDPILLEARQVVADQYGNNVPHLREQALSGAGDEWFHTKVAIAALSRGRALERGESPVTNEGAGR